MNFERPESAKPSIPVTTPIRREQPEIAPILPEKSPRTVEVEKPVTSPLVPATR